jgi:heme/copper-type cytochrome/quinol oxidase subunit 3
MAKANAPTQHLTEASTHMGLKAPGMITFLLSFVLMMAVVFAKFFGARVPFLNENTEVTGLFIAYMILSAGCLVRSL